MEWTLIAPETEGWYWMKTEYGAVPHVTWLRYDAKWKATTYRRPNGFKCKARELKALWWPVAVEQPPPPPAWKDVVR